MKLNKLLFAFALVFSLVVQTYQFASAEQKEGNILRIAGPYNQEVANLFSDLHSNSKLEFIDEKWTNSDDLMRAMVTNDTQYDVYYVSMDWGFDAIKSKRFCVDLSSSQVISRFIFSTYPQIQEVIIDGEFLAAIPATINMKLMSVNQELVQSLPKEYQMKDYSSYLSLLLKTEELRENMDINVIACPLDRYGLMTMLLRQYVLGHESSGEPVTFDDEAFMSAVELVAQFPDEVIMREEDYDKLAQFPTLINLNPEPLDAASGETGEILMSIPPLSEDASPVIEANLDLWIINPNSENIPLAASFLECVVQTMPLRTCMLLCPNQNEPVVDKAFSARKDKAMDDLTLYQMKLEDLSLDPLQKKEIQEKIDTLESFLMDDTYKWSITPNEIESYRKVAPYIVFPSKSLFLGFDMGSAIMSLTEITDQYLADKLSVKQMVDALNQKAKMLFLESH